MTKKKTVKKPMPKKHKIVAPESVVLPDEVISKPYTIDEATEDGRRVGFAIGYDQGKESGIIVGAIWGSVGTLIAVLVALYFLG